MSTDLTPKMYLIKDLCREIRSLHFTHRKYEELWAASVQQYSERRENVYKV